MANTIIILGKSGTGKSTSIKTLDPKTTIVLNVLNKKLPFKGSSKIYSTENQNIKTFDENGKLPLYKQVCESLKKIAENCKNIKTIVIDDAIYIMRKEWFSRATENGYNKYTELSAHFQEIIQTIENLPNNLNVILMLHSEDVVSDGSITEYKVATIGKLLDNQYNLLEVVPIVLYALPEFNDTGVERYGFCTKTKKVNGTIIPAKSPEGLFEEDFIPNDLGYVIKCVNEYFE